MFTENEIQQIRGAAAVDAAGVKIGTVGDVYLDDASGQPAWATVESGLFGTRVRFVPLGGASLDGRRLVLGFGKDAVFAAPHVAEDEHLSAEEEAVLYAHYGVSAPPQSPPPPPATATDATVTASPESDSPVPAIPIPVVPGFGSHVRDDEALQEAVEATEVAHQAAQKADPIGDGSYAGDASKATLIDTADLETYDHRPTSEVPHGHPAIAPTATYTVDAALDPAGSDLPEGLDPADVAVSDRQADARSLAAEARWAARQGKEPSDPEDDL